MVSCGIISATDPAEPLSIAYAVGTRNMAGLLLLRGDNMPTVAATKCFRTHEEQVNLLVSRGLNVDNRQLAIDTLKQINYYRLSAYSLTLRKNDEFYPQATFENILEIFNCDNSFRGLVLKYTSVIEGAFRTYISYQHSKVYKPLGYLNNQNFHSEARHAKFINRLYSLIENSKDVFIEHHKNDLSGIYPFWVAIEITTFDVLSKLYKNLLPTDRAIIAKDYYNIPYAYIENWLEAAVIARNIGAHGGRFFNRPIPYKIKLPSKEQGKFSNNQAFAFIYSIYKLLPTEEDKSRLIVDFNRLFIDYPFVSLKHFGFPDHWEKLLLST